VLCQSSSRVCVVDGISPTFFFLWGGGFFFLAVIPTEN